MSTGLDIYNNIKERLTNPLVFSFLCAWFIWNYEITIALFWYGTEQVKAEGYSTLNAFIREKTSTSRSIIIPLIFALSYTFLMPIIKNSIRAFNTWAKKWGNNWNHRISKGTYIPIEKLLEEIESSENTKRKLQDVINNQADHLSQLSDAKNKLLEAEAKINELGLIIAKQNAFRENLFNVRMLDGYWINTFKYPDGKSGSEEVFIEDGKFYNLGNFAERTLVYNIHNFTFNSENKVILFVKVGAEKEENIQMINQLRVERDGLLVGHENQNVAIEYQRK